MIVLNDIFQQINDLLPKEEKCKSFMVFPLPYGGYFEICVDGESGKKYRCLATATKTLSGMTPFNLPYQDK